MVGTTTWPSAPIARCPQWWIIGGVTAAWTALVAAPLARGGLAGHLSHGGHSGHVGQGASGVADLAAWALMCVAMTIPVTLAAVRHVYRNSIRSRRQWATAVYLAAYLAVWVGFGAAALGIAGLASRPLEALGQRYAAVVMLSAAAVWQLTRTKRRALLACRRTIPLPPQGRRADVACARFGLRQGWRCLVSCWPLMVLMILIPVHIAFTAALAGLMYTEERTRLGRQLVRPSAVLFIAAATAVAISG